MTLQHLLGIDVDQLIKDLLLGIRLQTPIYCPLPIATLIEKCFHESPEERPDFKEIKAILVAAYEKLLGDRKESAIKTSRLIDKDIKSKMQVQYTNVIQMNKEKKESDNISRAKNTYYV